MEAVSRKAVFVVVGCCESSNPERPAKAPRKMLEPPLANPQESHTEVETLCKRRKRRRQRQERQARKAWQYPLLNALESEQHLHPPLQGTDQRGKMW